VWFDSFVSPQKHCTQWRCACRTPLFVFYQLIENVEASPILPHELHELLLSFESTLGARPVAPLIRRTSEEWFTQHLLAK
jgi:hypothetical protein